MTEAISRRFISQDLVTVRVERAEEQPAAIVGYGAVFFREDDRGTEYEIMDNVAERIAPTAFNRAIEESHDVVGLFNHNADNVLGRTSSGTMSLAVDERGLKYRIDAVDATDIGQRVLQMLERGDVRGSSFAFIPTAHEWIDEGHRHVRQINDLKLIDTGPVTYPAYQATTAGARAIGGIEEIEAERDAWLRQRDEEARRRKLYAFRVRAAVL